MANLNLGDFKKYQIYLILSSPERYSGTRIELLKHLIGKLKLNGIYVSTSLPAKAIISQLEENKINNPKLKIVEGVNGQTGIPMGLVELSIKITALINNEKFQFLVFDSASTLLINNNEEIMERFLSFMINKLRIVELNGIFLFINDEKSQKVANVLSQTSDRYIKVN